MPTGRLLPIVILAAMILGCAGMHGNPMIASDSPTGGMSAQSAAQNDQHRLWQDGTLFFNGTHDRVDVVPRREARFHLNTLKFLEEYCSDCVQIKNIKNNGDDTIDLTVKITHPFPGFPEFTGFDVKGILIFNGSYEMPTPTDCPLYPDPFRISWRLKGDPEVLNPDGYSVRWSPSYKIGSSSSLFNYWAGKYSSGTPTANINAYLDFYSDKNRHMFTHSASVTRDYHIYLPPGPLTAGYAVEACWEPPTTTPVVDPANDFPISANQDEPYHFRVVVNNGQPITHNPCCGTSTADPCSDLWFEAEQWGGFTANRCVTMQPEPYLWFISPYIVPCDPDTGKYAMDGGLGFTWPKGSHFGDPSDGYADGTYRTFADVHRTIEYPGGYYFKESAFTIFDVTVQQH